MARLISQGLLAISHDAWRCTHGSLGASLIPKFVTWTSKDYSSNIRYLCSENLFGVPVFQSLRHEADKTSEQATAFYQRKQIELTEHDGDYEDISDVFATD